MGMDVNRVALLTVAISVRLAPMTGVIVVPLITVEPTMWMHPLITQDYYTLRVMILTAIFAILTGSWDLLSGFTGQMNFGHALFCGV